MEVNSTTTTILSRVTFRDAIWLFPPAFTLHVLEEWPRFTSWTNRYTSPLFTQREYNTIHVTGIIASILFTAIVSRFPNRALVFVFFAFIFAPSVFFNTLFHAGANVVTQEYCPGVITALTLYLPIFFLVSSVAWRQNLLDLRKLIAVLIVAGSFHICEVGHNVYKAW